MTSPTIIAGAIACATLATSASAVTLRLDAVANAQWQSSDFSIIFDDTDGDETVSLDEVISFSGFESFQLGQTYSELLRLPVVAGFVDGTILVTSSGATFNTWLFGEGPDFRTSISHTAFSYSIAPVPVPTSGLMLLTVVGGLAALRRRKVSA